MDVFKPILLKFWSFVEKSDAKRIASQTPTPGITQLCDIPYVEDGKREHLLDIYYPEGTKGKLPVIVDVHGGGWLYGYKEINKYYCLKLAEKGFLVASINYRLAVNCSIKEQIRIFSPLFHGSMKIFRNIRRTQTTFSLSATAQEGSSSAFPQQSAAMKECRRILTLRPLFVSGQSVQSARQLTFALRIL